MLSDCRSCVCISGCVKRGVKSYCVKVGAADPGPVVTVAWSFVERPSTVNLLHSHHTKGHFHLWVPGGGCATESTMKEQDLADLSEFFLRKGIMGIPLLGLQNAKAFLLQFEGMAFGIYNTVIMSRQLCFTVGRDFT